MDRTTRALTRASFVREAPDVRRQSLIDATARCLARRGASGLAVRAICAEAGVSAGLLTHYFSGIDELVRETYRAVTDRVARASRDAAAAAGDDPRAALRAHVLAAFRPPVRDPELLATYTAFWSLARTDPAIGAIRAEVAAGARRELEELIDQAVPAINDAERRRAAIAILALLDGLWLELCLDGPAITPDEACVIATRWIDSLLSG